METVKVTVTNNVSANIVEYNVNNLDGLINELNKIGKLFCLMYGDAKVFHSLIDIINDHELKDNDNYTIVYLDYDKDLIFKIKEMKDNNKDITNGIEYISTLFKKIELYDDPIFVVFIAINIPWYFNTKWFSLISDDIKNDSEVIIKLVRINPSYLKYASEDLRNNKEIVLESVKENGNSLQYVYENFKKDREIVLAAVQQNSNALVYASEDLKNNKEIVLVAVKNYGWSLIYASEGLKNNRKIVLEAVKQNGNSLEYASENLKKDREIVLEAVKRHGNALKYASNELRNDEKFLLLIK